MKCETIPHMADDYYCAACGCPVNEHDDQGVCHALDLPHIGHLNVCMCPGLRATAEGQRRALRDALTTQIVDEDRSLLKRLGDA